MHKTFTAATVAAGTLLTTLDTAWSQATPPANRPSPSQLFGSVSGWISNHHAAAIVLALAVLVGIGMLIFNRMGPIR